MHIYVNHQAMREVFEPSKAETDPSNRAEMLNKIMREFVELTAEGYGRTAYELKKQNWSVGQISEITGVSGRKIKYLISAYSKRNNVHNPLLKRERGEYIDISHLVGKVQAREREEASQPRPLMDDPAHER